MEAIMGKSVVDNNTVHFFRAARFARIHKKVKREPAG
jgi:hypothetical protein